MGNPPPHSRGRQIKLNDAVIRIHPSKQEEAIKSYNSMCEKLQIKPLAASEFLLMSAYLHVFKNFY
jgi:hypothetical protein